MVSVVATLTFDGLTQSTVEFALLSMCILLFVL